VFTLLFFFWALLRASDPAVSHTEQPMDAMWVRAAMAADAPPVRDAWYGGAPATYYTDGHRMLALFGTLLGEPAPVAVNLGQILWFALTGLLCVEAGGRLAGTRRQPFHPGAALLALLLVLFTSTPQGAIDALNNQAGNWWWEASRVLYSPPDLRITEFPFFTFWLGDNHAHLLGLPILLLSVLAAIQLSRARHLTATACFLAALAAIWSWRINPWQAPLALALPACGALSRPRPPNRRDLPALWGLLPPLLLIFPIRAPGLAPALEINSYGHTTPAELAAVFGFLFPGLLWLGLSRPRRLPLLLALAGIGLFLAAELFVVRDLFHNRMNTVFKFYYQIWVLWALAAAAGWCALPLRYRLLRPLRILTLAIPLLGLAYATRLSLGASNDPTRSLHAWSTFPAAQQHLLTIADRLIQPDDRIAEAPGTSYDPATSLLGTWTAGNTLLGWTGHQRQWRSQVRHPDLAALYQAPSEARLTHALRQLELDWVLLGPNEHVLYTLHPDWKTWMRNQSLEVVSTPPYTLYRIRK